MLYYGITERQEIYKKVDTPIKYCIVNFMEIYREGLSGN